MLLMRPGSFPLNGVIFSLSSSSFFFFFFSGSEQLLKGHNIRVLMIKGYVYEIMID